MSAPATAAWQLPVQWPSSTAPQERAALQATRFIQGAIVFAILALTVLDRFGVRVMPGYSVPPGMVALYALLGVMVLTGTGMLSSRAALAYLAVACAAGLSYLVNAMLRPPPPAPSLTSFLLLLVLYLPFAFTLRPGAVGRDLWRWMVRLYIGFAVFVAAAGIAQFFLQFVFRPEWLFNYMPLIPEPIRASGGWNTVNWAGDWIKSNGFFLREASIFSVAMAFALICELSMQRRKWVLAILAAGLVLTYSGSGLLCLAVAMLFPLDRHCLPRVLACVTLAAAVYFLFGEALNLGYTVERVEEVNSGKTSAYCRFVYPNVLILQDFDSTPWASLLGNGPGTMPKLDAACANGVETTYAKAIYEYGLIGALAFLVLVLRALKRSAAPIRIQVALGVMWLFLGGNLLTSEFLLLIFLFSAMWPAGIANDRDSNP